MPRGVKIFELRLPTLLQLVLNVALALLSIILLVLLTKELINLWDLSFSSHIGVKNKSILTGVLTFFLYFEFLAMIVKYFKEDYHFPLRYFMYIGITATTRYIVVEHDDFLQTLYVSASILILVVSYAVITLLTILKKKLEIDV